MKTTAKKCFVIIPFADEFEEIFRHAIQPATEQKGYHCERLKEVSGPINIINEIVSNIFEADLVVADLSRLNPNVFYELGIAHAGPASVPTVMIAEQGEHIPFDISIFQVLKYERGYEGIVSLRDGLLKQIEFTENKPHLTSNPVQDFMLKKKYMGKQRSAGAPKAADEQTVLENLQRGQLQLGVLEKLATLRKADAGYTISELYRELDVQKRKMLVAVLDEFLQQGVVQQKREGKIVRWQISERGEKIAEKTGRRHS